MSLEVAVRHTLGNLPIDIAFASHGSLTALFGRSGAGKTSLINMIAGLLTPQHGRIVVGEHILLDTERRINIPRHRRQIGYVFQEGRLFPHMNVRSNLQYGRWFRTRSERAASFDDVVDLLGLAPMLARRPDHLSGGEKQRVALGRALLASPRILLMDEPLASLDDQHKAEILPFIERLRDANRVPIVYVSHSVAEVSRLATTVVLLAPGRVVRVGTPAEVIGDPALFPFRGDEAGAVIQATIVRHDAADGLTVLDTAAGPLYVSRMNEAVGTSVRVLLRARDVMISLQPPVGISAQNVLPAIITDISAQNLLPGIATGFDTAAATTADVRLQCGDVRLLSRITIRALRSLQLAPGQKVFAILKTVAIGQDSSGPFVEPD